MLLRRRSGGAEELLVRPGAAIVPRETVTNRALLVMLTIMTFVAGLIVGAAGLAREAATQWRADMVREVTIQVRSVEGRDLAAEIGKAIQIARRTPGVVDARSLTREETGRLLEPWLGSGVDLTVLPLPRLIAVRLADNGEPDLEGLRRDLKNGAAGASLDDHRIWSARLAAISDAIVIAGFVVLALVLAATMLLVSFATRGAVAASRAIVEVLHFLGARHAFIAGTFQRHFLAVGLKGGAIGGAAAALVFVLIGFAPGIIAWLPGGEQAAFLTGHFALDRQGYFGIVGIVVLVAMVTTLASRITLHRMLHDIE
jgi:cell division transport system permease protein